jgi:hypothetical protein
MALSAVASAGVATPGVFKGAVWSPNVYKDLSGCASARGTSPHWSKVTGDGKMSAAAAAATCSKARGGTAFESYSSTETEIDVKAPVKLHAGTGGVNVTWNIVLTGSDSATYTVATCPTTYSYSYHINYGYTWYNYSYSYAYCSVEASVEMFGDSYVTNTATGASNYSTNYWSTYNDSGVYNDSYNDTGTYSNSSYWSYNYTNVGSYNYSYGPGGSLSGTYNPTWFINGTFVHSSHYVVNTYLYLDVDAEVEGYNGHASAIVNAATGPNHLDLRPFLVW